VAHEGTNERRGTGSNVTRQALADRRSVEAYDLRTRKFFSFRQIADELGMSVFGAHAAYERGVQMFVPKEEMEAAKTLALLKLDTMEQMALEMWNADHWLVNFGKLVIREMPDGTEEMVPDWGPKNQAINTMLSIQKERRAIIGYTAPSKRVVEVVTADVFDKAIQDLNREAADLERATQGKELAESMQALRDEVLAPPEG
jgi:hypothetical protein